MSSKITLAVVRDLAFSALVQAGAPQYGIELPLRWADIGCLADYWEVSRRAVNGGIQGYEYEAGVTNRRACRN